MVETPSMHLQHPEWANDSSQDEVTGSIPSVTCVICGAAYAPSDPYLHFLQVSPVVLESAYMSMCHFCFRCRRPACPECWDAVHSICGACVQETDLPFRTEVKPLEDMLFPPSLTIPTVPSSQAEPGQQDAASLLFVCIHLGRFHHSPSSSEVQADPYTAQKDASSLDEASALREQPASSEVPVSPSIVGGLTPALNVVPVKRGRSTIKKIERILTVIILLVLLAMAVLIALAEFFPAVNTFIDYQVHIDIRAEIAYLLHLVQQLL